MLFERLLLKINFDVHLHDYLTVLVFCQINYNMIMNRAVSIECKN